MLAAAILLARVSSSPAQSVLQGLAAYLNFDNNINAQAGTTNNGTIYAQSGDPNAKYTAGIIGQAASFNKSGSAGQPSDWAITLGKLESVYSNSFSFSLWSQTPSTVYASLFGSKDWTSGGNIDWLISEYYTTFLNYKALNSARRDIGPGTS